jgi:hypothetical protein
MFPGRVPPGGIGSEDSITPIDFAIPFFARIAPRARGSNRFMHLFRAFAGQAS